MVRHDSIMWGLFFQFLGLGLYRFINGFYVLGHSVGLQVVRQRDRLRVYVSVIQGARLWVLRLSLQYLQVGYVRQR